MLRKAISADLKDIMKIIKDTIVDMHSYDNTQWDENYPQDKDFLEDIQKGDLYVSERNGVLLGFVCINKIEPAEYKDLAWSIQQAAMIVHRMAVAPAYRRNGIGTELMNFVDEYALKNNIHYLKTDTYSINTKMNALFMKFNYKLVGEMSFLGKEKPFYCYEKVLNLSK